MMPGLDEKKPTYAPAYVVGIYPGLAAKARELGYALALHGSLQRDLDLIAVPWTDAAVEPVVLLRALCAEFDVEPNHAWDKPEVKPHGRLGWSIPLWWGAYLDLAVMPREQARWPQAFGGMRNALIGAAVPPSEQPHGKEGA